LSSHSSTPSEGGHPRACSAYDDPGTPEEITRRTFMANATLAIGGVIGGPMVNKGNQKVLRGAAGAIGGALTIGLFIRAP